MLACRGDVQAACKLLPLTLREAECAREDLAARLGTDRDETMGKIEAVEEAIEDAMGAEGMRVGDALLASVRAMPVTDSIYRARGAARAARWGGRLGRPRRRIEGARCRRARIR